MIFPFLESGAGLMLFAGGLALLVAVWWSLNRLEKGRAGRLAVFADSHLLERLVTGRVSGLRWPLNVLVAAGLLGSLLALAGPRWGEGRESSRRGSREILVVLDTSESMNAVDPAPSRLARAREKIGALLEACPGDRFALIAFSGAAVLECPLTRDHAYFKTILESITTDTLTEEGTDIEAALLEAERLVEDERGRGSGASRGDRMTLLVSDGEGPDSGAVVVVQRLKAESRVAVMGIGDPGGAEVTLPQWMVRSKSAPVGPMSHWSALNEGALSAIAVAGGGVYVRSTLGGEDLLEIQRELAPLQGIAGESDSRLVLVNRYRWPLAAAILLFAGEGVWLVWMPRYASRIHARTVSREGADGTS